MMIHRTLHTDRTNRIKQQALLLAVIWTLVVLTSIGWALYGNYQSMLEAAGIEARSTFNKDLLYRRWAAMHGGVYVPVTEQTPPNPYLNVPNRDVMTTDGLELTLINPAYMTRQVHEIGRELYGVQGHITSLNPIRPANTPDDWETTALHAFETGATQFSSIETVDGQPTLRYMQVLMTEQECLTCHINQGYEVGDVRGGISVSVPLQPYMEARRPIERSVFLAHSVLWLFGIMGILLSTRNSLKGAAREAEATYRLQENEAKLRNFIEESSDGLMIIDENGRIIEWNPSMSTLTGINAATALEAFVWDIWYATTKEAVKHSVNYETLRTATLDLLQSSASAQMHTTHEATIQHPDGTRRTAQIVMFPIKTDHGYRTGCILRDITEQKRIETELRESEERMKALLRAMPDMMFRIQPDGTFIDYHAPEHASYLIEPQQFVGHNIQDILPVEISNQYLHYTHQAAQTHEQQIFEYVMADENQQRIFEARIVMAGPDEFVNIVRDITERKQMEDHLHRYRNIVSSTEDGIALVNRNYIYEIVNDAYLVRQQTVREAFEGHHASEVLGTEVFQSIIKPHLDRALNGETLRYTEWFTYPTLGRRYMQVTYYPYHNDRGHIDGVVANVRDITRENEAQQREFDLILEQERRHMLTTFIQNAAHEFRTPLATINSSSYLLSRTESMERRVERLGQIEAQVQRITKLVDMLLLMARLESNGSLAKTPVDISILLVGIQRQINEICDSNHVIRCEVSDKLPSVLGDTDYLADALRQIIDNACRFTPDAGTIAISASAQDDHICIEICDTGPGIPPEALPHIFETFWRHDTAHSTPGFGLGLSIARKIVEEHGGQIAVESTEGVGTTFRLMLPASA